MLISEYKEHWTSDFIQIREVLLDVLNGINVDIQHIGSTSVAAMAAKPIIDIDIVYYEDLDFGKIKSRLESIGYFHYGDQGVKEREAFKRNGQTNNQTLDYICHHLYVCHCENEELKRHILFRDHLRSSKSSREAYIKIKKEIASQADQNQKAYALIKETKARSFINDCIRKQEKINGK